MVVNLSHGGTASESQTKWEEHTRIRIIRDARDRSVDIHHRVVVVVQAALNDNDYQKKRPPPMLSRNMAGHKIVLVDSLWNNETLVF
jgi:hypothetical protein